MKITELSKRCVEYNLVEFLQHPISSQKEKTILALVYTVTGTNVATYGIFFIIKIYELSFLGTL